MGDIVPFPRPKRPPPPHEPEKASWRIKAEAILAWEQNQTADFLEGTADLSFEEAVTTMMDDAS